jgi:hypothetical protein
MKAKDMIIEFINLLFLLFLIAFVIIYIVVGDRVGAVVNFMKLLTPFAFLGIIFIIKMKLTRQQIRQRKEEKNTDIVLYLTTSDKFKGEIISFLIPISILLIAAFGRGQITSVDIFQAVISFLIFYFWYNSLFKKER